MSLRLVSHDAKDNRGSCAVLEFKGRLYAGVDGRVLTSIGTDECGVSLRMERRFYNAYHSGEIIFSNVTKLSASLRDYFLRKEVKVLGLMDNATPRGLADLLKLGLKHRDSTRL